jgi:hypothetical protein
MLEAIDDQCGSDAVGAVNLTNYSRCINNGGTEIHIIRQDFEQGTLFVEQNQGGLDEPFARPYLQTRGTFYRYHKLQRFLAPQCLV